VTARYKAQNVFAYPDAGIVGSNPIQDPEVRLIFSVFVPLFVDESLATG
jgi:hypothetical protein